MVLYQDGASVFQGNMNTFQAVTLDINKVLIASKIRFAFEKERTPHANSDLLLLTHAALNLLLLKAFECFSFLTKIFY